MRVRDIGEQGLLKRLQQFCPRDIVGDDGAVLSVNPDQQLVVTTDILVNGVHFSHETTPPDSVGWRATAANLSDLAAMGAMPLGITVGLSLPGDLSIHWIDCLYQGISQCLQTYKTPIIGGDICRSEVITVSITALGQVSPDRVIRRSTANPGDAVVITGYHGMSRGGLELLLNPHLRATVTPERQQRLIAAHQYPQPRLDVLPILWEVMETHTVTGMDSSDGLADAIVQICEMSGTGAKIDRSRLITPSSLREWVSSEQALQWILYGGEDFELVLCLPKAFARELIKKLGEGAAIIGEITDDSQVVLIGENKQQEELILAGGFQHFS